MREAKAQPPERLQRCRVLLIEDNPGDVELIGAALSALGEGRFQLVPVSCLAEALAKLEEFSFDLVAVDLALPDSVGRSTYDCIRAAAAELPIVVLTGHDDCELALELIHQGAQDFLVKWDLSPATILRSFEFAVQRKRTELELCRARQEALRSAQAKTAFVASMSHEIRTPLNAILGMAELLLETPLDEEQQEYVHIFRRCGGNLLDLLNNVLELSRIDADQVEIIREPFHLVELIEDVAQTFGYPAHRKRLALVVDVHDAVPLRVRGDAGRLRQVLSNLVGNAIKFTDQGEVRIEARPSPTPEGPPAVRLRVEDSGVGIPPERLKAIFEPFVQADGSVARDRGGSGLGLALCKGLVERMGGRLGAEPRADGGMRFDVLLPLPGEPTPEDRGAVRPLAGRTLLLAIASDGERAALRQRLEAWGGSVVEAASTSQALACLEPAPETEAGFDAALIDARLPEAGGLEVARWLHERPGRADRVVVLLPMDHRLGDAGRARAAGAASLLKPARSAALLEALTDDIQASPGPEARAARALRESLAGLRVLLVDDAPDNRVLLTAFLDKSGCIVEVAENGAEALEAFAANSFDLVLMDMQMPVMDGYEATRAIRGLEAERGLERTPVLALTAYAFQEQGQRCLEAGCDAHIAKPIDKRTLLATVQEHACVKAIRVTVEPDLADLVPGYLANRRAALRELREALSRQDFATVARLAHDMKGTGAAYGFAEISEIGRELEAAAGNREIGRARSRLRELESYLDRVELVPQDDGHSAGPLAPQISQP